MGMTLYNTRTVAQLLGYCQPRIVQVCRKLGLEKLGMQYIIKEDDIPAIKAELGKKQPGRPRKKENTSDVL